MTVTSSHSSNYRAAHFILTCFLYFALLLKPAATCPVVALVKAYSEQKNDKFGKTPAGNQIRKREESHLRSAFSNHSASSSQEFVKPVNSEVIALVLQCVQSCSQNSSGNVHTVCNLTNEVVKNDSKYARTSTKNNVMTFSIVALYPTSKHQTGLKSSTTLKAEQLISINLARSMIGGNPCLRLTGSQHLDPTILQKLKSGLKYSHLAKTSLGPLPEVRVRTFFTHEPFHGLEHCGGEHNISKINAQVGEVLNNIISRFSDSEFQSNAQVKATLVETFSRQNGMSDAARTLNTFKRDESKNIRRLTSAQYAGSGSENVSLPAPPHKVVVAATKLGLESMPITSSRNIPKLSDPFPLRKSVSHSFPISFSRAGVSKEHKGNILEPNASTRPLETQKIHDLESESTDLVYEILHQVQIRSNDEYDEHKDFLEHEHQGPSDNIPFFNLKLQNSTTFR